MQEQKPRPQNIPDRIGMMNFQFSKDFMKKYKAQTIKKGAMMARKPMREKLICQKEVARKKVESSAINSQLLEFLKSSLVKKQRPNTVRIPNKLLGNRSIHGSISPINFKDSA